MNYSKLYFSKELNELTYQDIENFFIDEKDESNKIEFKSYYSPDEKNYTEKENGVIRAICGLLNSEGGLVIWGAPIGQTIPEKKEKVFKGALSPVDKLVEKDKFISRITDLITPSPTGINFQPLEKAGQYVYIIEVVQSFYLPHQFRNIYYMRIDGQTKPAPHHFIEALFRKVTFPKLEGYIKLDSIGSENNQFVMQISSIIFNKSKLQNEHNIYIRLIVTVGKFALYGYYQGTDKVYNMDGHELICHNAKSTLFYNEPLYITDSIIFDRYELNNEQNKFHIILSFGGESSPLMTSEYKLEINDIYTKDLNSFIISMTENQYIFEKSDKILMSEKEKLKLFLGR